MHSQHPRFFSTGAENSQSGILDRAVGARAPGFENRTRLGEQYDRGGILFGAAAHQAGIPQSELTRHAYARGMEPPFSAETLAEEFS